MGDAPPGTQTIPAELARATLDPRLTPAALRVVLDVARRGPGEHEIPFSHFRSLIQAGEKVVRREVALAVDRKWIQRRVGGRGNNDLFAFTPAESAALLAHEQGESDTYPGRNGSPMADSTAENGQPKPLTPAESAALPLARESSMAMEMEDEPPVSPKAAAAMEQHADTLSGCRGALRDYLADHVPEKKQPGFVHSVATWLDGYGYVWKRPDGSGIPKDDRPGFMAAALNEVSNHGEGLKYPIHDVRNLKTKLDILTKPIERRNHGRSSSSTDRRGTRGGGGADGTSSGEGDYSHLG